MYPESLEKLIASFRMLPGVGEKTAERYALVMSEADPESVRQFSQALLDVKAKLIRCKTCGNLSEEEECDICRDQNRDHTQICVVQSPKDVIAFEKTGEYKGVYHVLGGLISSSKGIMPEDLNLDSLLKRAADAKEVILATSATLDGETTAMYLEKVLQNVRTDLVITRISHGLPIGGLVDYADEMTLIHALADRRRME